MLLRIAPQTLPATAAAAARCRLLPAGATYATPHVCPQALRKPSCSPVAQRTMGTQMERQQRSSRGSTSSSYSSRPGQAAPPRRPPQRRWEGRPLPRTPSTRCAPATARPIKTTSCASPTPHTSSSSACRAASATSLSPGAPGGQPAGVVLAARVHPACRGRWLGAQRRVVCTLLSPLGCSILHRTKPDHPGIMKEIETFRADPLQPACDEWCAPGAR